LVVVVLVLQHYHQGEQAAHGLCLLPLRLRLCAFDCTPAQREDRSRLPHRRAGHSLKVKHNILERQQNSRGLCLLPFFLRAFDCTLARPEDRSCLPRWTAGHLLQVQQHNHQGQQTAHRLCLLPSRLRLHPCAARRPALPASLEGRTLAASPVAQLPRPASRTQTMLATFAPSTAPTRSVKTGAACLFGGQDTRC
jgi:hypothetical protein